MLVVEITIRFLTYYIFIGLIIHIALFLVAKVRSLDEEDDNGDGWYLILNSVRGLIRFLLIGSIQWLPVTISFMYIRINRMNTIRRKISDWSLIQLLFNRNNYLRERFIRKYQ